MIGKCDYCSWEKTVSAFIAALSGGGIRIFDIEDFPYRESFDQGLSPRTTAEKAIDSLRKEKSCPVS